MNYPEKFVKLDYFTRELSKNALKKFMDRIKWRTDGKDVLLDIGCGPGNVLYEVVVPEMPSFSTSLIYGIDISKQMIDYCSEKYSKIQNMIFIEMDVFNLEDFLESYGEVDHVTAFLLFHFFRDHAKALRLIKKVLKPNGDLLLTTFGVFDHLRLLEAMGDNPKWKEYIGNISDYLSPYSKSSHPDRDFRKVLEEVGMKDIEVDLEEDKQLAFHSVEAYKEILKSVTPLIENIPSKLLDEFLNDAITIGINKNFIKVDEKSGAALVDYNLITAFCRN